jgi:cyclopropane-fatty-acyl-phospholipid synthase
MSSAAESLLPLIQQLCGGQPPLRIRCWDGSEISTAACAVCAGDGEPAPDAAIVIKSPMALRRILWQPN